MKIISTILVLHALALQLLAASPQHLIVAVAPNIPEPIRHEITKTVGNALYRSEPGTRITIIQSDPLGSLADVKVPDGSLVLRQQLVSGAITRFNGAMRSATNIAGLWVLPRLLDEVGRNWMAPNDILVLVGPALHNDPRRPAFNFATNWPSDGHLLADSQSSPFSTVERRHLLDGVRVFWVVTDANKMVSDDQALAVRRFWSLYVTLQGGVLVNYSSDVASVFANAAMGRSNPVLTAAVDPKDTLVRMHPDRQTPSTIQEVGKPTNNAIVTNIVTKTVVVTVTNVVELYRETILPRPAPGKSVIGVVWASPLGESQAIDVDIYVKVPRDGTELSYGKTTSANGRYFRDIRQAQNSTIGDWRAQWEAVELNGDDLPPEIWINLYSGKGPVQGEVRVLRLGQVHRIAFTLPAVKGNGGNDSFRRERSEHWLRIDLKSIALEP